MKNFCFSVLILLFLQDSNLAVSLVLGENSLLTLNDAELTVSANIFYGNEDELKTPVRTNFRLLKESFVETLKKRDFQPVDENDNLLTDEEAFLEATARALTADDEESVLLSVLIEELLDKNKIVEFNTNYLGRGKTGALNPGNYYLFGYARVGNEVFVWNLPLKLKRGQNHVEIDQYNTDAIVEIELLD